MRRSVRLSFVTLGTILLIFLSGSPIASAATSISGEGGNGIRVSPVITNLTVNPGTTQVVTIDVTNVTAESTTLETIINDFVANPNESGNPEIILNPNQYATSHSLKQFIRPIGDVTLAPGQEMGVPVTITVPKGAAGGGYYGVVRFAPAGSSAVSGRNVTLAGSVGSLILIKVPGNLVEDVSISGFDIEKNGNPDTFFTSNKDLDGVVRFQNEGNIQEQPFGKMLLKNGSKIVGVYSVNNENPPGNVLPNSIREFSVPLPNVGTFGKFTLEGNFGYGSSGHLISASTTFYVIPFSVILGFIIIVLVVLFLIFGMPKVVKSYNRRVIRRASRR